MKQVQVMTTFLINRTEMHTRAQYNLKRGLSFMGQKMVFFLPLTLLMSPVSLTQLCEGRRLCVYNKCMSRYT